MRTLKNKEKFVIATKLLVDPTGKKMGKTEGNMITLVDSSQDMFGKVMSWSDPMIIPGLELCTKITDEAIAAEKVLLDSGANPRDSKIKLAHAVTELYHGTKEADKARDAFFSAFSKGAMQQDAPQVTVVKGSQLGDILVAHKIVASKTEFRRLLTEKAIKDLKSDAQLGLDNQTVEADLDLKIGKHRFLRIRVK
jgi:tyrosyl-tRNA synthetase